MSEGEVCCNDGWIFLNKRPTLMCLATFKKAKQNKTKQKQKQKAFVYRRIDWFVKMVI